MIGVRDKDERFIWRLALALGKSDPYEMVRNMPARVLEGWKQFEQVEPFGPRQEDRRAGEIAAILASVYRDKKKHYDPFEPVDFFPSLSDILPTSDKPKPPGQLLQIMEAMFLARGKAKDNRTQRPRYDGERSDA